ncbi:MAG: hypothetical protein UX87_C0024G0005 [Candidatus Amesbacteria bacterium GW2011_GWA1_47_16]|uniref:Glycosyltransferase RgtA/B/C/D-like domain-containing protein n=3 Tax=Candidatus Amesiibacteriota TaxID=1752730 RepID=A0A0G1UYD1_9BACT|nr:MAG: hypothetical protein UX86_C0044G0004 [Candidatus Amesbacteria bacterium GW2011_GWC1_47_15]KKU63436.1 MAG: hypothetical protein UX87_C0024G0005 [Candidatus Amesbacteria bacterium GW2011_GWA1_47_16]OGD00168.1 MAG: hypothetical protein A2701_04055 [Candidatus Amesbacteria bacterium RIFCSPHIGHO2_01_FULL_47_34]OGD01667.1 MAG: hypothetical protein A2972_04750 [Candidatus Amesbacteria bacterium RIFCSPLOWO2_01_FULL_47_33]
MKYLARVAMAIWGLVLVYHVFVGLTTAAWEGDSLAYHIPIAQRILNGDAWRRETFSDPFFYYPAWGEAILAAMTATKIPVNLYNVLAWVWLFWAVKRLGKKLGLMSGMAVMLAASVALLNSVVRLLPTQTVDIWLAVFWTEALIRILNPERSIKSITELGLWLGLLAGTKLSGVVYALLLPAFYGREWLRFINWKNGLTFLIIAGATGGLWYFRNLVFTGSFMPLPYETTVMGWVQNRGEDLPIVWRILVYHPGGVRLVIEALFSEYLIWGLAPLAVMFGRDKLGRLGAVMFWMYLFMPAGIGNVLSDFRYLFPAFIAMMTSIFFRWQKRGWGETLSTISLGSMAAVLTQLDFRPKLIVTYIFMAGIISLKLKTQSIRIKN